MGSPLRSRLGVDERRAQLLELGMRLFGTRPYDEVSIDDIAADAGVSKGLLYHYFGSKRAFYVATVQHAADTLVDALASIDPFVRGPARVRAGLAKYIDFVQERDEAYVALITSGLGADPEVASIVQQTREGIVTRLLADLGQIEPSPVYQLAMRAFVGAVEAAALDWLARRDVDRSVLIEFLSGAMESTVAVAAALER